MEQITAYKPKCCNRAYMSKYSAIRHERKCPKNPDNRACQTCKNRDVRYDEGEYWYCEHFEKVIDKYSGTFYDDDATMKPIMNCEFWEGENELTSN